jgi:hypothetical protein
MMEKLCLPLNGVQARKGYISRGFIGMIGPS